MSDTPGTSMVAEIKAELTRIENGLRETLNEQNAEIKKNGSTSTETSRRLSELEAKYDKIGTDIRGELAEMEAKAKRLGMGGEREQKSAGAQFVESAQFKSAAAREQGGMVRARLELKALTGDAASAGDLIRPARLPAYVPPTEPHIRDLFAQGVTSANALEFPQFQAMTNNAAPVYDQPTTAQLIAANYKPESDMNFTLKNFPVRTIAHLMRVHKNILDDAPALRSIIDEKMLWGLAAAEDYQFIKGDGTGNNLSGLLANSQTYNRAKQGDTKIDTLRRAMTQLRLKNYAASGIVLNPTDWEDIELTKDSQGRYIWVSVQDGGTPRLWRAPVVDTQAMDPGEFVTGDFKQAAQIFDREQAAVEVFEQDRDNVPLNLITIRVEERLALVIYDQNGFVKGAF